MSCSNKVTVPKFEDLPLERPGPPLNAWGLWGKDDELGRLNLITEESVKRGKDEIKDGIVINLNLPLSSIPQNPVRKRLHHHIVAKGYANDDELTFNSQCSTQWDGFRHYPYQNWPEEGKQVHYNGLSTSDAGNKEVMTLGVQTARAHLLDIPRFLHRQSLPSLSIFDPSTPISPSTLQSCAEDQGVIFAPGDILLVRTGWTEAFFSLSQDEQEALPLRKERGCVGVETSLETMRWHWENGIAAVASDCTAYEAWPPQSWPVLHEIFLSGWGMPIGESFDLRELARVCEEKKRWTFFMSSVALNVPGGIASPANAVAFL